MKKLLELRLKIINVGRINKLVSSIATVSQLRLIRSDYKKAENMFTIWEKQYTDALALTTNATYNIQPDSPTSYFIIGVNKSLCGGMRYELSKKAQSLNEEAQHLYIYGSMTKRDLDDTNIGYQDFNIKEINKYIELILESRINYCIVFFSKKGCVIKELLPKKIMYNSSWTRAYITDRFLCALKIGNYWEHRNRYEALNKAADASDKMLEDIKLEYSKERQNTINSSLTNPLNE